LVFSARVFLEFVKTPQAEYEAGFVLTVGQLLSIPFIVVRFELIVRAHRQRNRPHLPARSP
jgi:prolipoprotein diacylglyceryltransferase